jgi:hypothetical protein
MGVNPHAVKPAAAAFAHEPGAFLNQGGWGMRPCHGYIIVRASSLADMSLGEVAT